MKLRYSASQGAQLLVGAVALSLATIATPSAAQAGAGSSWQGTILCTTRARGGYHSFGVDRSGRLAQLTLASPLAPGLRVELNRASTSRDGRSLSLRPLTTVRVLGRMRGPLRVRGSLIEDGYSHYRFYRNGRPWGCRVAFDDTKAVPVAKLILSGRRTQVTLALHNRHLIHLGPRQTPPAAPAQEAKAKAATEGFLALLSHDNSIAACKRLAADALLIHGGPNGCLIAFDSAKFLYRDRYTHASVEHVALFTLDGHRYALATIKRPRGYARAILIHEHGTYRYLGDLDLSPIELW
jgi:hypothetical protein